MEREYSPDYGPVFEALWAETVPSCEATEDCLSIPRLAELQDLAPTEAESEHLERCVLCRRAHEASIAESLVATLTPREVPVWLLQRAAAQSSTCEEKVDLLGKLDDGRSIEFFSEKVSDSITVHIYGIPRVRPYALRVSDQVVAIAVASTGHSYGLIRRADLPGQSPKSLRKGELSLIFSEVGKP